MRRSLAAAPRRMVLVGVLVDLVCSAISSEAGKSRDPHELQTDEQRVPTCGGTATLQCPASVASDSLMGS